MSGFRGSIRKALNFAVAMRFLIRFMLLDRPKLRKAQVVFFFPYYHTGGAERVHLEIVSAFDGIEKAVVFTMRSATSNFLARFHEKAHVVDAQNVLTRKQPALARWFTRQIASIFNDRRDAVTLFGSNSDFFYSLLPCLNERIRTIDLFHAFAADDARVPVVAATAGRVHRRIVINQKGYDQVRSFYHINGVNDDLMERVRIIGNGVTLNTSDRPQEESPLTVAFAGRWSPEKRPELFLQLASRVKGASDDFRFMMFGTGMRSNLAAIEKAGVHYLGEVTDDHERDRLYLETDVIVITSLYEGFPMVLMEGMSCGVIPLCVDVGGITEHLSPLNGIVIGNGSESSIVTDMTDALLRLHTDRSLRQRLSVAAREYAVANFGIERFQKDYRAIIFTD
ncbi:MAG TPA: glycosyltransferase family 4 protein [Flavobacterium sp.]|nr:glycosyltransferase family 4 protein [Flavobacterium sp.]